MKEDASAHTAVPADPPTWLPPASHRPQWLYMASNHLVSRLNLCSPVTTLNPLLLLPCPPISSSFALPLLVPPLLPALSPAPPPTFPGLLPLPEAARPALSTLHPGLNPPQALCYQLRLPVDARVPRDILLCLCSPPPPLGFPRPSLTAPAQRRREELRCRRRRCCCWRWAGASAVLYSLSKAFAPPAAAAIVFPASARQEQTGPAPAPLVSGAFPAVQTTGRQRTTLASGQKTCNQQGLRWLSFIFCLHLSSHLGFLLGENSAYLLP